MKLNQPISGRERPFTQGTIVTKTDLKGIITYANDAFVEISGFDRNELIGTNHNIVRHPDMPPTLFGDMWKTLKRDKPWQGLVKTRCKNGDHYWVSAFVVPIRQRGQTVGYMSVRTPAERSDIAQAEALHRQLGRDGRLKKPRRARLTSSPTASNCPFLPVNVLWWPENESLKPYRQRLTSTIGRLLNSFSRATGSI